jgi:hypothetical protein
MTEAQIFKRFLEYLATKTDSQVFNVPYGKIETIPHQRMKLFLLLTKHQNCPIKGKLEVCTVDKGEVTYDPFFVIDPFDRSKNPMHDFSPLRNDLIKKYLHDLCGKI